MVSALAFVFAATLTFILDNVRVRSLGKSFFTIVIEFVAGSGSPGSSAFLSVSS